MVYLQILLLLLVVLTQVLRPDAIARWDRLHTAKLHLLISLGIAPVLMLLSRIGIVSSNYPAVMPWSAALEGIFFVVAASFYLFCLKSARSAARHTERLTEKTPAGGQRSQGSEV